MDVNFEKGDWVHMGTVIYLPHRYGKVIPDSIPGLRTAKYHTQMTEKVYWTHWK